jgi:predicted MFS family arabinose efflux permease
MDLSTSNSRKIAWIVWIIASMFYTYQYILRVLPNIMFNDIVEQFNINAATFGQFSGIYYLGYSLMHLPIGIMLDRFGPKKVISSCVFLTVIGLMPLLFADQWVYPIMGRFLIGLGSSGAILGVFKIIRLTFAEKQFPRMLSISVMIGLIGAIYGGAPVSYLRDIFGYQTVIKSFAIGGIFLAILTYWIIPNMENASNSTIISDIKEVLKNKRVISTCLFAGLMVGPLEGFADVWGNVFLNQVYGYNMTFAASISSMIFVGMCFGSPVLSFIADKVKNYFATIVGTGIVMASCFFALIIFQLKSGMVTFSFILVGICCAYQILAIYKASTFVKEQVAGLTTAVANMIIMTFGYAFHTIIGKTIDIMGGTSVPYALTCGIVIIPIALCFGSFGFAYLFFKEKGLIKAKI